MTDPIPVHDLLWREYREHLDSTPRSIGYTQWLIEKAASLRDQLASKDARIAALERDVEARIRDEMTFAKFQAANKARCEADRGFGHRVAWDEASWPLQNWALAIAGEAGELCNLVKKCLRGDFTVEDQREAILEELADVMTYADLAISSLGADTATTLAAKFNKVSARISYPAALDATSQPEKRTP